MVIGVDFDNTIVSYDLLFHQRALAAGLIEADMPQAKSCVRNHVREVHGDIAWQRLQGEVYGPYMHEAQVIPGVFDFFRRCRREGIAVRIVSHKTLYGHFDATQTSLPGAALGWLERHDFFECEETGLTREMVYFEPTRQEKIARIERLGCTHFIDDLPEVLLDSGFPSCVRKILFASDDEQPVPQLARCSDWPSIEAILFGEGSYE